MIVVYKLIREDGKQYIGKATNFKNRLAQHRKHKRFLEKKIQDFEILCYCNTNEEALYFEKFYIEKYDTFNNGLNETKDGTGNHFSSKFSTQGYKFSENTKRKMSTIAKQQNRIKSARAWHKNLSEEDKKTLYKTHSQKTKGKPKPTKISKEIIEDILINFNNKIKLEKIGEIQRNGKKMSYRQAFALYFSKKYNISPRSVINIIENRILTWKPLYEQIINTKF